MKDTTPRIHAYKVKAVGLGFGFIRYPMEFEILSNFDIETDREMVMQKVRNTIKRTFQSYEIISVKKEIDQ